MGLKHEVHGTSLCGPRYKNEVYGTDTRVPQVVNGTNTGGHMVHGTNNQVVDGTSTGGPRD